MTDEQYKALREAAAEQTDGLLRLLLRADRALMEISHWDICQERGACHFCQEARGAWIDARERIRAVKERLGREMVATKYEGIYE